MGTESRDGSRVAVKVSWWERMLNRGGVYTVWASRKSVGILEEYVMTRKEILEKTEQFEGEVEVLNSIGNQIRNSLSRNTSGGLQVVLSLKIDDVRVLGQDIIERGVRFPPILEAVSEIVKGRGEFSDIENYSQPILDKLANMPGNPDLAGSLKRLFLRRRYR